RTHGKAAWSIRLAVFVTFTSLFAGLMAFERTPSNGPRFGIAEIIILPIVIGVLFVALIELPTLQRIASITEHDVHCMGSFAMLVPPILWRLAAGTWNRKEIKHVELLRPKEGSNRFGHGLMIIVLKYTPPVLVGVARSVRLEQLADTLHAIGIEVSLS